MKAEDLIAMHDSPGSWRLGFFYYAPADPRIIVRKRLRTGWTVNFARPMAVPLIFAFCGATLGLGHWLAGLALDPPVKWAILALWLVATVLLCGWLANPRRYDAK